MRLMQEQVFPGNNIICLNGRAIAARDLGALYMTFFMILVMTVLYFVFESVEIFACSVPQLFKHSPSPVLSGPEPPSFLRS